MGEWQQTEWDITYTTTVDHPTRHTSRLQFKTETGYGPSIGQMHAAVRAIVPLPPDAEPLYDGGPMMEVAILDAVRVVE